MPEGGQFQMQTTRDLNVVANAILSTPPRAGRKARLIAISGIDSSGKGYAAGRLAQRLPSLGARVALIGIDGWLNLPQVRFSATEKARHFYRNAIRFDAMFSQLVDPLVRAGSVDCQADFAQETAQQYRKQRYVFSDVDTVLLEGIFLLRRDLRERYDLKVWVECSFETALRRAIARGQEGLTEAETIASYQTIYFPAQKIHFTEDDPQASADVVFEND
jgi:uridine kinase